MRAIVVAVWMMASMACGPSAEELRTKQALEKIRAENEQLARKARGDGLEGPLEKQMSFNCAQEWRAARSKGYGTDYLSSPCRTEYEKALKATTK